MQQLKLTELEGWTAEVEAALSIDLGSKGIHEQDVVNQVNELAPDVKENYYNSSAGMLYELSLRYEEGSAMVNAGALAVQNGKKAGRPPLVSGRRPVGQG